MKAVSVASYFKDRHYSGHKNESFETLLLRYETYARQLSLTPKQMSMCFPNALEGTDLDLFHTHLSMDTTFPKIVQVMSCQFDSEHHQQQLPSQMQAAKLEKSMKERKHDSLF